jgi:hypothetical protein
VPRIAVLRVEQQAKAKEKAAAKANRTSGAKTAEPAPETTVE